MTRCSTASRDRDEPVRATASVIERFLLIEDPGPWGPHVLHSARLPEGVRATLRHAKRTLGLRTLLVRRPSTSRAAGSDGGRRVFAVNTRHGSVMRTTVDDLVELAHLDLTDPSTGSGSGRWSPHGDPIVLVCTHGKHDPCCAERGRPLAASVAEAYPELTWEASHLGGDRFAGNLVLLPRGDYFGRLDPVSGPLAVARHLDGHLDLAHHRGRSTQGWVAQAAEAQARAAFGASGFDDVVVVGSRRGEGHHVVDLLVFGEAVTASVVVGSGAPARLTCHAGRDEPAPTYRVVLTTAG